MNDNSEHSYLRTHQIRGPALAYDLDLEAASILDAARLAENGRAAKTLVKEGPLRLTIMGLTAGSYVTDHKADGPMTIEVRTGIVKLSAAGADYVLADGDLIALDSGVYHSLVADTDGAVLLSIAMPSG